MTPGPELERRLRAAADHLPVGAPPINQIVRRGRRRLTQRVAGYALVAVLLIAMAGIGLGELGGLRNPNLRLPGGREIPKPVIEQTVGIPGASHGAVGTGETLWTADYEDRAILQVDTTTNRVVGTIPLQSPAYDIVAGEGAVWAMEPHAIERIDPITGRVVATVTLDGKVGGVTVPGSAQGISVGGGSVWVTVDVGDNEGIDRIDPTTNQVVERIAPGTHVWDENNILFAGGALWIGSCEPQAAVYRVRDGHVDRIVLPSPTKVIPDGCLSRFAAEDGILWVSSDPGKRADSLLRGIDLASGRPLGSGVGLPKTLNGMGAFDGVFWITYERDGGSSGTTVLQIADPATGELVGAPITLGADPGQIGFAGGSLWIPVAISPSGGPALIRVRP